VNQEVKEMQVSPKEASQRALTLAHQHQATGLPSNQTFSTQA
jgi:hypothetical protein